MCYISYIRSLFLIVINVKAFKMRHNVLFVSGGLEHIMAV
jgi:hypothetical protein